VPATAFFHLVAAVLSALRGSKAAGVMALGSFLAGLVRSLTMQLAQRDSGELRGVRLHRQGGGAAHGAGRDGTGALGCVGVATTVWDAEGRSRVIAFLLGRRPPAWLRR